MERKKLLAGCPNRRTDDLYSVPFCYLAEDFRVRHSQSCGRNVAGTGNRVSQFKGKALEPGGRGEHKPPGWLDVHRKCMGDATWPEHEGPWASFQFLSSYIERHVAFYDVPRFVFRVMDMERRLGGLESEGLDH